MTLYDIKFQLLIALEAFVFLGGGGLLLWTWWLLRPSEEITKEGRRGEYSRRSDDRVPPPLSLVSRSPRWR